MAEKPPLEVRWTLRIAAPDPRALAAALAPESQGFLELAVEGDDLVARGTGTAGETLHTVDDLLACLGAALKAVDALDQRRR